MSDEIFLAGNNNKAGLPEQDRRQHIDQVIYEASKSSKFYQHQQERLKKAAARARILREAVSEYTGAQIQAAGIQVAQYIAAQRADATRDTVHVHVDMDAFFASVEQLHNPALKDVPMAVGCEAMLSTANYEARKWGVSAAMPGFIARKLCPRLVIVPLDYDKYLAASEQVRTVFKQYDASFAAGWSLDEACLDFSGAGPDEVFRTVERMRAQVHRETGLTCSAGIASNRLLAKMASNVRKPNGQFMVPTDEADMLQWLHSLPVKRISGVGKVTELLLERSFDIRTIRDLHERRALVWLACTRKKAEFLVASAHGLPSAAGGDDDDQDASRKSVSAERTYFPPIECTEDMKHRLSEMCGLLADELAAKAMGCCCVTVKIKHADFTVLTRSSTVHKRLERADDLYSVAVRVLERMAVTSARLIGVRASGLESSRPTVLDRFVKDDVAVDDCVACPVCAKPLSATIVNEHLDRCLAAGARAKADGKRKGPMDLFVARPQ